MSDIEKAYTLHARYLLSITHDEDLAEELTQETFFRAMRTINNYDGSCKLSVWLCQIAKHIWYYCYSKTLWNSLFYDYDLSETRSGGSSYGTDMYGDSFQSTDYKSQMIEIYYLPTRNFYKLDNISDEDYDAQREIAYPVWSGVV